MKMKPEYEDLKKMAKTTNQPFQVIHNEVLQQLYQTYRIEIYFNKLSLIHLNFAHQKG